MNDERMVQLYGRIVFSANIELLSGLHIGGAAGGLEIGGVDKPVIRNPFNEQPYIPGSSLKGKIRSLLEKAYAAPQNHPINKGAGVYVHLAENEDQYERYPICSIFGTFPQHKDLSAPTPTRLTVRDVPLTQNSEEDMRRLKTDLPYTEVKWEASIDRVTSAASPRQIERVPAGAIFGPAEFIFSVYSDNQKPVHEVAGLFVHVLQGIRYLEHDYLGGMGTRGSGRVQFTNLKLTAHRIVLDGTDTESPYPHALDEKGVGDIAEDDVTAWLKETFA